MHRPKDKAHDIAKLGVRTHNAANEQLGFDHPANPDWRHISFCLFAGPSDDGLNGLETGAAGALQPGKVHRSPTRTALSARMAVLHPRGHILPRGRLTVRSLIGSTFSGTLLKESQIGNRPAIIPEVYGRGWITGIHPHMLAPSGTRPKGYRVSDTWGAK